MTYVSLFFLGGANLQSGVPFFRGGKVRLIQLLLDYLSVASPESGLSFDWSKNKRYLELSHNWFPVWPCDFRSKKSCELINSIMTSDEASEESEFLSALTASLESFVHKALKDEQMECIHRFKCNGRDVLVMLPTGLRKSTIYQFILKVLFHMGCTRGPYSQHHIKKHGRTPCFWLAHKVEQYLHQVTR